MNPAILPATDINHLHKIESLSPVVILKSTVLSASLSSGEKVYITFSTT
jgi:hypothetical protein